MARSSPTQRPAYRLCTVRVGAENWQSFASLAQAVLAMRQELMSQLGTNRVQLFEVQPLPAFSIVENGTWVLGYRDTRYQAEHNQYGALWRVRREWLRLAIYGKSGRALPVRTYFAQLQANVRLKWNAGGFRKRPELGVRGLGPVWGIRKSRGGPSWFRSPRTGATLRQDWLANLEEGGPLAGWRRRSVLPPTDRDDLIRTYQRSWKVQGKHGRQWRRQKIRLGAFPCP